MKKQYQLIDNDDEIIDVSNENDGRLEEIADNLEFETKVVMVLIKDDYEKQNLYGYNNSHSMWNNSTQGEKTSYLLIMGE